MGPKVFIGSSTESLDTALALQSQLERKVDAIGWHQGVFGLSEHFKSKLMNLLDTCNFGVFIFDADADVDLEDWQALSGAITGPG